MSVPLSFCFSKHGLCCSASSVSVSSTLILFLSYCHNFRNSLTSMVNLLILFVGWTEFYGGYSSYIYPSTHGSAPWCTFVSSATKNWHGNWYWNSKGIWCQETMATLPNNNGDTWPGVMWIMLGMDLFIFYTLAVLVMGCNILRNVLDLKMWYNELSDFFFFL
jgi:hypothetical protein